MRRFEHRDEVRIGEGFAGKRRFEGRILMPGGVHQHTVRRVAGAFEIFSLGALREIDELRLGLNGLERACQLHRFFSGSRETDDQLGA